MDFRKFHICSVVWNIFEKLHCLTIKLETWVTLKQGDTISDTKKISPTQVDKNNSDASSFSFPGLLGMN